MEYLLDEIDRAADGGFAYLAVMMAFAVPDIAGALASADGKATGARYRDWYDANINPRYRKPYDAPGAKEGEQWLSAKDCYKFRCSALHQHRAVDEETDRKQLFFFDPGLDKAPAGNHLVTIGPRLLINARVFSHDMTASARTWLQRERSNEPVKSNLAKTVKRQSGTTFGHQVPLALFS